MAGEHQVYCFEFRGTASEYFRIWIVNMGLTLLTLGIYSAWAKVRKRRYFYANTLLDGAPFDYHANPIKILKGRVLLVAIGICYAVGIFFPPVLLLFLVSLAALPWLTVRGMIFNLSNTSYRGVRFGFDKVYRGSYKIYLRGLFFTVITLGFGGLYWPFWYKRFALNHTRYGQSRFTFSGTRTEFVNVYIVQIFLVVLIVWVPIVVHAMGVDLKKVALDKGLFGYMWTAFTYAVGGACLASYKARSANFFLRHTQVGDLKLEAKYNSLDLYLVYVRNFFACLLTLGLAWPWAKIELAKYRATCTAVVATPEAMNAVMQGAENPEIGALGDELSDIWGFDLGF